MTSLLSTELELGPSCTLMQYHFVPQDGAQSWCTPLFNLTSKKEFILIHRKRVQGYFLLKSIHSHPRAFSFPTRNILMICYIPRRIVVTRNVTFRIPMVRSGLWMESNRTAFAAVTHAPAVYSSANTNLNHIRLCFPKRFMIRM